MTAQPITFEPYRLTWQDWLNLPEDGRFYEIIEGELFMSPAPAAIHQRLLREIFFALHRHLIENRLGEVLCAPFGVRLTNTDVLEPDLLVLLEAHRDRISERGVLGPADLVVEILSPGTAQRDLGIKRDLYEAHGVSEYWIVDPRAGVIEVLTLTDGAYARHGLFNRDDTLTSALFDGLTVALSDIFPA